MHVVHNTTEGRCTMYNVQLQCPLFITTESLFTWGESIIVSDFTISVYGNSCTVLSFCPISLLFLHNFLATCLGDEIAKAKEREWGRKRDNYMKGRILYVQTWKIFGTTRLASGINTIFSKHAILTNLLAYVHFCTIRLEANSDVLEIFTSSVPVCCGSSQFIPNQNVVSPSPPYAAR